MLRVYPATFGPGDVLQTGSIGSLPFVFGDEVKQVINGDWCLTFSYPVAKQGAELVALDNLVLAEGQLYRINRVRTVDSAGKQLYEVEAPHIAFDLLKYCIENIETSETDLDGITAAQAMAQVLANTPFSVGTVDVGDEKNYLDILQQNAMEGLKQIVSLWGGELFFDNFTISLRQQCGAERNYPIRQGKNISALKYTEDLSGTITRLHVIGYNGADIKPVNDGKDYLDSQYIGNYSHILEGYVTFDDEDMPAELKLMGQEYLAKVEVPQASFDISLVNLKGSPQYALYAGLETFELGDTAILHHDALKIDFALRCQERVFYASTGVNKSVKLGNTEETIAATLSAAMDTRRAVQAITGKHNSLRADRLEGTINALKTLLYASAEYQAAEVKENQGVLFENNDTNSTSYGAMYIGPGIFAIANTKKADGSWNWRTFGNGSGFTADLITAGELDAARVKINDTQAGTSQSLQVAYGVLTSEISSQSETLADHGNRLDDLDQSAEDFAGALEGLQEQIDGEIDTWFYEGEPTASNLPASQWTTAEEKARHVGDLYYDTATQYAYRYTKSGNNYVWTQIADTGVTEALAAAQAAQDTADNKRRVFYSSAGTLPTPPYDKGDLWVQGSGGDILRCNVARAKGATAQASDWVKASKYTDDAALEAYKTVVSSRFEQTDASIIATVTSEVSKVRVGGRNLLRHSDTLELGSAPNGYWQTNVATGGSVTINDDGEARLTISGRESTGSHGLISPLVELDDGWMNRSAVFSCFMRAGNVLPDEGVHFNLCFTHGTNAAQNYDFCWLIRTGGAWSKSGSYGAVTVDGYLATDENAPPFSDGKWHWVSLAVPLDTVGYGEGVYAENTHMQVRLYVRRNGDIWVKRPQLEWGNHASEWSASPDDLEERVSKTETSLSVLDGEINATVETTGSDGIAARLTKAESKITDSAIVNTVKNSNTFALESDLTAGLGAKNKVWTTKPSGPYIVGDLWLVQADDGSFKKDEIYRCKTAATSGFSASHWVKASKYTDDTKANSVETLLTENYSTTTQTNTQITSTVTERIGLIRVGGENLLRNSTGNLGDTSFWTGSEMQLRPDAELHSGLRILKAIKSSTGTAQYWTNTSASDAMASALTGEEYVLSGWYYADTYGGEYNDGSIRLQAYYDNNSSYDQLITFNIPSATRQWTYFEIPFTILHDPVTRISVYVRFGADGIGSIQLSGLMLQSGNKASAWTPSPLDTEAKFYEVTSEIDQKADAIGLRVKETYVGGIQQLPRSETLEQGAIDAGLWNMYTPSSGASITVNADGEAHMSVSGLTANGSNRIETPMLTLPSGWQSKKLIFSCYVKAGTTTPDQGLHFNLYFSKGGTSSLNYDFCWVLRTNGAWSSAGAHYTIMVDGKLSGDEYAPAFADGEWHWVSAVVDLATVDYGSGVYAENTHVWGTITMRRNGDLWIKRPKIEYGSIPSAWSPNPQEFRNSAVAIDLDGIKLETGEKGKITAEVGGEEKLNINKDGVTGSKIVALESLEAPNVLQKATSEDIPWKGGIQASLDAAPKYLNGGGNLIIPAGTYNEDVEITGFVGGQLILFFINGQVTIRGKITIRYCDHVRFYVLAGSGGSYNLNVVPQSAQTSTVEALCVKKLRLSNMYISGYQGRKSNNNNNVVQIDSSCAEISGCCVEWGHNAIHFTNGSTGYVSNCIGGVSGTGLTTKANINKGVLVDNGSHVGITGKVPLSGSTPVYAASLGTIVGTATGTAGDGTVPTPSVYTKTYAITKHCTYIIGDSRIRDDQSQLFSQGRYGAYAGTGTSGWRKGVMWFDGLSELAGKTIQSATLTLYRGAGGNGGSADVNVYATTLASGSYTSTTDPGLTGTAVTQAVGREAEASFDVTALVKTAISSAKYGLAVYEAPNSYVTGWSYGYAQIYGMGSQHPPVLTVTYK